MEHLIPSHWFVGLHWWVLLAVSGAAVLAVVRGADWLVEGASGFALRAGMSKVIVGATIVSLGTTAPECAVSVMAAWGGDPGLALGNAVGSIIADTGLIFGVGCLLMTLPVDRFLVRRQGWVQFGAGLALAGVSYLSWMVRGADATLGRSVGVAFLLALACYIWASVKWGREHAWTHKGTIPEELSMGEVIDEPWWRLALKFVAGLTLVLVFGHVLIQCVKELAHLWGVPQVVIASTIVAFGTSLPELAVAIAAIRKGHPELLIGNVIGADILNVLFVIGASATAAPLPLLESSSAPVPAVFLLLHLPTMLLVLVLFRLFTWSAIRTNRFRRWFGVPLLGIYLAYLLLNYLMGVGAGE